MACGTLLQAGLTSKSPVERYAAAPIVVAGSQSVAVNVGTENEERIPLFERVHVSASLAPRLAALDGVQAAVADISVPARVKGSRGIADGPGGHATALHPWAAAVLTPYGLEHGRAPRGAGELVVDAGVAARGRLRVGQRVLLESNGPDARMTVVGVARPSVAVARQGVLFASMA